MAVRVDSSRELEIFLLLKMINQSIGFTVDRQVRMMTTKFSICLKTW